MIAKIYSSLLYKNIITPLSDFVSNFKWENLKFKLTGRRYNLKPEDWQHIAKLLAQDYYVILIRRNSHLTTYLICIGDWLKRPRFGWGHYSHVTGNVSLAPSIEQLEFIEAIETGVQKSKFEDIFNCDSVCLLKPKGYSRPDFNKYIEEGFRNLGKKYDNAFNVQDQSHMSCVEVYRDMLRELPDYFDKMSDFEDMIWKVHNLTPQMYYDCADFERVFEIRR